MHHMYILKNYKLPCPYPWPCWSRRSHRPSRWHWTFNKLLNTKYILFLVYFIKIGGIWFVLRTICQQVYYPVAARCNLNSLCISYNWVNTGKKLLSSWTFFPLYFCGCSFVIFSHYLTRKHAQYFEQSCGSGSIPGKNPDPDYTIENKHDPTIKKSVIQRIILDPSQ